MTEQSQAGSPASGGRISVVLLWAWRLLPCVLLPLMLYLSRDFGITWDERTQQQYGQRIWGFLTEGRDDAWFHPGRLYMYLYGGLFDALCIAVQRALKGDLWTNRHYANAAFGWVAIFYAGRIGRLLAGPGTGVLVMVLLVVSPRFLADAMANPKDIPFAALSTAALFYLLRLRPTYPFLGWRVAIPLVVSIGLAINVRAGGVLYLFYLAVALAGLTLARRDFSPRHLIGTAARWSGLSAAALVLGSAFWPWARASPLTRPFEAIRRLGEYDWTHRVLFDGVDFTGDTLPLDYVPRWVLMATPPVVLVGAVVSVVLVLRPWTRERWRLAALWGAALFPPLYVMAIHARIYDGVRHLLFAYVPLVVLAGWAWAWLLRRRSPGLVLAAASLLVLGVAEPLIFQWRNHPHQAVYFSPLVGGPRNAFGRYELDYWGVSVREAVRWVERTTRGSTDEVVVGGHPHHVLRDEVRRLGTLEYARPTNELHLEVILVRGRREDITELAERPDALHRVTTADGAPLSIVVPGPRFGEIAPQLAPAR